MSNYTFTGGEPIRPEQIKDTDLTHDSPHHTLGRGHTQAAPGNHTHKYSDIIELPAIPTEGVTDHGNLTGLYDDDHGQYPLTDGTRAGGTWPINVTGNAARSTRTGSGNHYFTAGTTVLTTTASGTGTINTGRTIELTVLMANGDYGAHARAATCDGWSGTNFAFSNTNASQPIRINWIVA